VIAKEKSRAGFTLVEMLAALAIVSMIILSTGTLVHQGAFFFDRGTRAIDVNEQLALAIDCLTRDFGAVRFVQQTITNGTTVAFSGEPTSADDDAKVVFVTAGGRAAGPLGEEVVSVSVETNDDASAQLVRRRSAWRGPRMRLEDVQPGEAVILLKGRFTASFSFSKIAQDGNIVWYDSWTKEQGLPHSVRLNMHDETTGADLAGAIFPVHADAPAACTKGKLDCLKGSDPGAAPKKP
jgi:prepilin-type N-terminal cleavage/methylation domain-containing protein